MSNRTAPAKLLAEFVGTFALIFIGAGAAAVVGSGAGSPGVAAVAFAHGLTVMAFAFAYGTVSGGHFNPSVTIAVLAAGAMRVGEAAGYVISQFAGGILGAFLLRAVLGSAGSSLDATVAQAVQSAERTARDDNAGRVGEFLARAQAEREGWGRPRPAQSRQGYLQQPLLGRP
jgi:glycerol uptake facilitator-like aquaporin